jgi:hypothetical protein
MPRSNHNSTNESHHPQLQNGHSRRFHHDWNNNYNRIVNWQQAGTRRHGPSTTQPRLWGLIEGDNLWWLTMAIARGTQEPRTIHLLHDAELRSLRPNISRPVGHWDRREIKCTGPLSHARTRISANSHSEEREQQQVGSISANSVAVALERSNRIGNHDAGSPRTPTTRRDHGTHQHQHVQKKIQQAPRGQHLCQQ